MTKALLYFSNIEVVDDYSLQLQMQRKQVKLRDVAHFNEQNNEYADEAYITPEVSDALRVRIIEHLSDTMDVFNIENDGAVILDDIEDETALIEDGPDADTFFEETDEAELQAEADEKKRKADEAAAKAEKERSEAEAAKLKAQAEELEANQAEKEAEEAKQEAEDAQGELTRLDMISELRELEVAIPRKATKAQVQELYNEHVLNVDDRN